MRAEYRGTTGWSRWSSGCWTCTRSSRPRGRRTSRPRPSGTPKADATDRQIDQLVYELYGLADEEIAVVEGTGR
jgi:hypothetical protein